MTDPINAIIACIVFAWILIALHDAPARIAADYLAGSDGVHWSENQILNGGGYAEQN